MHYGTSLDMQQSECQNSFEHTFFSPCSHISRLNKDTRNPVSCSFLHYDKHRNSTRGGRRQCQKCRYSIDDSSQSAWQQVAHHGSWEDWSLSQHELCKRQENTLSITRQEHRQRQTRHTLCGYSGVFSSPDPDVFGIWEENTENSYHIKKTTTRMKKKKKTQFLDFFFFFFCCNC